MSSTAYMAQVRAASRSLLASNRVEVDGYRYTRPAPSTYEHQWLWDSCFHAIAWRWLDPSMAWDELRSVVAHQLTQGPDAGMLPHMTYWRGGGEGLWRQPDRSVITQPPLVALAAMRVHETAPDASALADLFPRLAAFHAWFDRRRDPDGDDLVCCIHPWESGWDASPRYDVPMRSVVEGGDYSHDGLRNARIRLAGLNADHGCDPLALRDGGHFHVEIADFNAVRAADLEALGRMADELGDAAASRHWRARASAVQHAVRTRMWSGGHVCDLVGAAEMPVQDGGAAELASLFGGCASREQAALLAARVSAELAIPNHWPLCTTPPGHAAYDGSRYWRGNVWLQVNWLVCAGLRRYGFAGIARDLAERSIALAMTHGFHEYYDPATGAGHGSSPHSWDALVLDLMMQMEAA